MFVLPVCLSGGMLGAASRMVGKSNDVVYKCDFLKDIHEAGLHTNILDSLM